MLSITKKLAFHSFWGAIIYIILEGEINWENHEETYCLYSLVETVWFKKWQQPEESTNSWLDRWLCILSTASSSAPIAPQKQKEICLSRVFHRAGRELFEWISRPRMT